MVVAACTASRTEHDVVVHGPACATVSCIGEAAAKVAFELMGKLVSKKMRLTDSALRKRWRLCYCYDWARPGELWDLAYVFQGGGAGAGSQMPSIRRLVGRGEHVVAAVAPLGITAAACRVTNALIFAGRRIALSQS